MAPELTLDDLQDEITREEAEREATEFKTYPGGSYRFEIDKVEPRIGDNPDFESSYDRKHVRVSGQLVSNPTGEKIGYYAEDLSWVERRSGTDNNLDKMFRLWAQMRKALDAVGTGVRDTLDLLTQYPVNIRISETAIEEGADGTKYHDIKPDGSRAEALAKARAEGWKLKNYTRAFSKVK